MPEKDSLVHAAFDWHENGVSSVGKAAGGSGETAAYGGDKKRGGSENLPAFRSGKAFCFSLWSFYCRLIVPVPTVDRLLLP